MRLFIKSVIKTAGYAEQVKSYLLANYPINRIDTIFSQSKSMAFSVDVQEGFLTPELLCIIKFELAAFAVMVPKVSYPASVVAVP